MGQRKRDGRKGEHVIIKQQEGQRLKGRESRTSNTEGRKAKSKKLLLHFLFVVTLAPCSLSFCELPPYVPPRHKGTQY